MLLSVLGYWANLLEDLNTYSCKSHKILSTIKVPNGLLDTENNLCNKMSLNIQHFKALSIVFDF